MRKTRWCIWFTNSIEQKHSTFLRIILALARTWERFFAQPYVLSGHRTINKKKSNTTADASLCCDFNIFWSVLCFNGPHTDYLHFSLTHCVCHINDHSNKISIKIIFSLHDRDIACLSKSCTTLRFHITRHKCRQRKNAPKKEVRNFSVM